MPTEPCQLSTASTVSAGSSPESPLVDDDGGDWGAYWIGLALIAAAQILDFLALADVSPVRVGASLALGLATLPFWRWVWDRRSHPTRCELLGIAIIVLASSDQPLDLDALLTLLAAAPTVVYGGFAWVGLAILSIRVAKPHAHPLESAMLSALLGAQLFLGSKALSGWLFHSASDEVRHPLVWLVAVLVGLLLWFQQRAAPRGRRHPARPPVLLDAAGGTDVLCRASGVRDDPVA